MTRVMLDIKNVPAGVVRAVNAEARRRNVAATDVIVQHVAVWFSRRHEPSGYEFREPVGDHWNLRVPVDLRDVIRASARERGGTMTGVVIMILQTAYGITPHPVARRVPPVVDGRIVAAARKRHEAGESIRSLSRRYGIKRETLAKAMRG